MKIAGTIKHSLVNGPGIRFVIFFQGCAHHCRGCHNEETWSFEGGEETASEDIFSLIAKSKLLDGVTLSGGDPFYQAREAALVARFCHDKGLNVWCYTGFRIEELMAGSGPDSAMELLREIDALVDGEFCADLKSDKCVYRGSTNQRIIDVPDTLRSGEIVLNQYN